MDKIKVKIGTLEHMRSIYPVDSSELLEYWESEYVEALGQEAYILRESGNLTQIQLLSGETLNLYAKEFTRLPANQFIKDIYASF